jgi:hypothetical protein
MWQTDLSISIGRGLASSTASNVWPMLSIRIVIRCRMAHRLCIVWQWDERHLYGRAKAGQSFGELAGTSSTRMVLTHSAAMVSRSAIVIAAYV